MHLRCLVQPHMPVYSGTLIKPSFFESSVSAHADQVIFSIIEIFGNIIRLCCISALFMSQIESIDPYLRITENSVELQPDMLSVIFSRNIEDLSIPADTGLRIFITHLLVSVAMAGFFSKRKVHDPVVRQVHLLPSGSIELHHIRTFIVDGGSLCKVIEVFGSATEILSRIRSITEGKLPVRIKVQSLSYVLCLQGCECKNT